MALNHLFGWNNEEEERTSAACGTACGASDQGEEKPAACGALDQGEEKPAACGTACGASDNQE